MAKLLKSLVHAVGPPCAFGADAHAEEKHKN
jgi:hypothetical protein